MQPAETIAEHYYILENPVHFKLSVSKRPLDARFVSATFEHSAGYRLRIIFSDGHEDEYQLTEFGVYSASGKTDQYCKALQKEIYEPLGFWTSKSKVYVVNFPVDGRVTNIWITGHEREYFSVYYLNEFYFEIKKEGGQWCTRVPKAYGDVEIDKGLLHKVIKALNYYTA